MEDENYKWNRNAKTHASNPWTVKSLPAWRQQLLNDYITAERLAPEDKWWSVCPEVSIPVCPGGLLYHTQGSELNAWCIKSTKLWYPLAQMEWGKKTKPLIFWDKPHKLVVIISMDQNTKIRPKNLHTNQSSERTGPDFTVCLWSSSKLLSRLGVFAAGYFTVPG